MCVSVFLMIVVDRFLRRGGERGGALSVRCSRMLSFGMCKEGAVLSASPDDAPTVGTVVRLLKFP